MNPTTLAFLVGVLLGVPVGLTLAAVFTAYARDDVDDAYIRGLEQRLREALARANMGD